MSKDRTMAFLGGRDRETQDMGWGMRGSSEGTGHVMGAGFMAVVTL